MAKYSTEHTVYKNSENEEVPSVTTVLKIINKPALAYWANSLGFKRMGIKKVLEERAAIGTDVHDMISNYTMSKEINGEHLNTAIQLFLLFKEWAITNNFNAITSELSLCGDEFGGTVDSVAHINGELCMVDYKTSKSIYPNMFLQLAGYSLLVKEHLPDTYSRIEKFGIISINETNGIQTKFISKKDLENRFVPVFMNTLTLFKSWFKLNDEMFGINIAK